MPRKRKTAALTAASLMLLTTGFGLFTSANPASATVTSCNGSSCVGHDPRTFGCPVTSTTTATYNSGAATVTLYNRYSSTCNSNWAEAVENPAAQQAGWGVDLSIFAMTSNQPNASALQKSCFPGPSNTGSSWEECNGAEYYGTSGWPAWTDMVDGHYYTWALLSVWDASHHFLKQIQANQ
ncbi:DUF2690 domain-containing protein [Streptomyces griseoluteus]|uniref:DUF2690 domain-containing protein n=1 Tax=Streptomyces griseoluteus TaxID=29306 RepID=UPI003815D4E1